MEEQKKSVEELLDLRPLQMTFRQSMHDILLILRNGRAIVSFTSTSKEQQDLLKQMDVLIANFEGFVIRVDAWIKSLTPPSSDVS